MEMSSEVISRLSDLTARAAEIAEIRLYFITRIAHSYTAHYQSSALLFASLELSYLDGVHDECSNTTNPESAKETTDSFLVINAPGNLQGTSFGSRAAIDQWPLCCM